MCLLGLQSILGDVVAVRVSTIWVINEIGLVSCIPSLRCEVSFEVPLNK